MLPSFPAVNTMGLAGVAPHVNPAFFGRGMAPNGMGMMGHCVVRGGRSSNDSDTRQQQQQQSTPSSSTARRTSMLMMTTPTTATANGEEKQSKNMKS